MRILYEENNGCMEDPGPESFLKKVWKLGWGVAFIAVMTILSECGPHTVYSKVESAAATSKPLAAVRCVK